MPQLRRREAKEVFKNDRAGSPVTSKSSVKRKKRDEVVPVSKRKPTKASAERKTNDNLVYSDDETFNASSIDNAANCSSKETKEVICEEVAKKGRTGSKSYKRKEKDDAVPVPKRKVNRPNAKRKTNDESSDVCTKENVKKYSSKKDQKPENDLTVNVKEETNDSENFKQSPDSGISSDVGRDEIKLDMLVESKPSTSSTNHRNESSSSESEWEEVENDCETASLDDYKPDIPKEGVEITIDCPDLKIRKRKKKQFDENEWIRLHINRVRKDIQLSIHKTHLLCLLAHGVFVNKILNSESVKGLALSLIPDDISSLTSGKKVDKIDMSGIEKIVLWFCDTFQFDNEKPLFCNFSAAIIKSFVDKKATNASEYNLMFIVIARLLGFNVRLCVSLYPVTHKASNLLKKPNSKKNSKKSGDEKNKVVDEPEATVKQEKVVKLKKESTASKMSNKKKEQQKRNKKKLDEVSGGKVSRPRRSSGKSYKLSSDEDADDANDEDFEALAANSSDDDLKKTHKTKSKSIVKSTMKEGKKKQSNRKVLSSDSEPASPQASAFETGNVICWCEIFSKSQKQWIAVECVNNIINKPYSIEEILPKPVSYILAYDNKSYVKDVTRRYCNNYMTETIKLRVDPEWWEETLEPFLPPNSQLNKAEEKKLDEMLVNKPLPTTIQGFKNHPLYALKRHLLKFEAIYPPDAPPVGFMRSEPVYARDCVHQLHSRETWLKEARVVKIGEEPYKIVKARPKWDRIAGVMRTDLPLEIFGHWQTEPYKPPVAVGGKVPRNEYGNVELFKPCMLPKGTVHLQLPGLNRVAKKLNIDCCPAVVGFDGHKGSVHPVFDGFIVCEEFKDTIIAAWDEEQENARKREEEKREKRIYGNWKKLIRGLLIRERIKLKYDTK